MPNYKALSPTKFHSPSAFCFLLQFGRRYKGLLDYVSAMDQDHVQFEATRWSVVLEDQ